MDKENNAVIEYILNNLPRYTQDYDKTIYKLLPECYGKGVEYVKVDDLRRLLGQ